MATSTQTPVPKATPAFDWPDLDAPRADDVQQSAVAGASELLSVLHINGGLVIRPRQPGIVPVQAQPLTNREREVLALVAEGNSNKIIGDRLVISERTVKSHLTYIMTKLRASDRTHAVVTAVRLGWLAI
ncbi:MAG: response regulator transcription factor [Chloroflexi bacterium]|nr:response regulator transcription factor [Chloroflexota bacterium]